MKFECIELPPEEQDILLAYEACERERMDLLRTTRDQRNQAPQALRLSIDQNDSKLGALVDLLLTKGLITSKEYLEALRDQAQMDLAELKRKLGV